MKDNYKKSFQLSVKIFGLGLFALLMSFTSFGQETNLTKFFAPLFNDKSLVWSDETNSFRTGVRFDSHSKEIDIWVLSSTNAGLVYVYPPSGKPPKLELQDTNGIIIQPIKNRMDGELPQRLPANDLRKYYSDGLFYGHGVKYKYFMIGKNVPNTLNDFVISDVYQVKEEANYTLTVFPMLYKFETNREYADRIDLPCVTTKIHLAPTQ